MPAASSISSRALDIMQTRRRRAADGVSQDALIA